MPNPIEAIIARILASAPERATKPQVQRLKQLTDNHGFMREFERGRGNNELGAAHSMIKSSTMSGAIAPRHWDEELRLLELPNGQAPDELLDAAAAVYPPGHFAGSPVERALYIQNLGSVAPGGGTAILEKLKRMYPDVPWVLESLDIPNTRAFYQKRGFIPQGDKTLIPGSEHENFVLPEGRLLKYAKGGAVEDRRSKLAREMTHDTSSAGQLPEGWSIEDLPANYGGGRYVRRNQELEAPFFDPTLPAVLGGALPKNTAMGILRALKGLGRAGAEVVERGVRSGHPALAGVMPLGVVKQKGGNWLNGSVEDALSGLKRDTPLNGFELQPEGHYYDPRRAAMLSATEYARGVERYGPSLAINEWIRGPLTKYIKTRMATPEDEVRKLAEQGVLHVDPASLRYGQRQVHPSGEHVQKLAQTPDALKWENAADFAIYPEQARTFKNSVSGSTGRPTIELNPWLANLSDDAPVYDFTQNMAAQDLGLPHLTDELRNALNPESGLPRHLQLTPEAVKNMSMEKAVRRVADINAWRAAQKAEAQAKMNAGLPVVREFAENNPKGLRWVELKPSELTGLPPQAEIVGDPVSGFKYQLKAPDRFGSIRSSPPFHTYEEALAAALKADAVRGAPLAEQLKYEGDTMGHCVGGYCDDVVSGRSRIFSLRDSKGEPHVTIEVSPTSGTVPIDEQIRAERGYLRPHDMHLDQDTGEGLAQAISPGHRIVQIKGKQNRAPKDEYLPFVQDFVRNSPLGKPWSDVGDMQNTGLTLHPSGKYVTDAEAAVLAKRHFGDVKLGNKPDDVENPWQYANRIRRYDQDMLSDADKAFLADWDAGNFASGGLVRSATDLHGLIKQLETR